MFIYMWTNNANGMRYIGRHAGKQTSTYKGSGKYFRRALEKFGEENFTREILRECVDIRDCIKWEQYYLDLYDAANSDGFYNISPSAHGGHHGADYRGEKNPMWGKKHPNHVSHFGPANGMYGSKRCLSENPNAKKVKLVEPNGKEHYHDSVAEAAIGIFKNRRMTGKIQHLIYKTRDNKLLRKDAELYEWKGYYV